MINNSKPIVSYLRKEKDTHGSQNRCLAGRAETPGSRPAGGTRVPRPMRDTCSCVHQDNYSAGVRAICDILATNVGIVRKSESQKQQTM